MCDTFVATPDATADGRMLFGKNSDREPGEAQAVEVVAGGRHPPGSRVQCTHLELPQASATNTVLIGRPYWMWGAEMGVNERGVCIGNEAVLTRAPVEREPGLLGMDLVRLGLERASSARGALDLITALLEQHGQGGRASISGFRYDNSFLICDAEEAWVLETARRAWVAKRVRGVRSISNGLSLRDDWELGADGLAARARDYGLSPGPGRLDFARVFSDRLMTWGAGASRRRGCTEAFLAARLGRIEPRDAMRALRQHGAPDRPERSAGSFFMTVCGHASWTPMRSSSQTTGSLVSSVDRDGAQSFVTATSAPCLSLFKPVWLDAGLPRIGTPGGRYDPRCLWWRHERLHRAALVDLAASLRGLHEERDAFEMRMTVRARSAAGTERRAVSTSAFADADALEAAWLSRLEAPGRSLPGPLYRRYWQRVDSHTGLSAP